MGARYSSFLLLGVVVTSLSAVWGAPTDRFPTCGQYSYYDHGTDSCEHCREICDNANVTRTVEQCWDQCRAYALILWPPSGPPGETPAPDSESSDLSNGTSDTISSGAAFGVVILIVAFMLAVLFTVFFKRKAIVKKFIMRRANRLERSTAVVTDPPAAQPTGQQGRTNPYVPLPQDLSVAASPGSVPSSAAATAGTQEQGATGPSEGNHSWRILPAYQPTPSPGRGCIQLELRSPVQVSMEGNGGAAIMALPGAGQPLRPAMAELVPEDMPNDDPDDFNSTELKTLLPSVDDSLTTGVHGGPVTTRV